MPKDSHHGENVHRMEQVPERQAQGKSPDLLVGSGGNLPPAKVKRPAKRQAKKPSNQTQT